MGHRPLRFWQIFNDRFLTDVAKLSIGTLSGRLISFVVLPILTRIYSPAEFSILATYLAVLGTLSVTACFRIDVAIPIAESDEDAINLMVLALGALLLITLSASALIIFFPTAISDWLGNPLIEPHLWLVPMGIGLAGAYSVFQFWATRVRRFGEIARTRVFQSCLGSGAMVVLGWWGLVPLGLLLGNTLSLGAGVGGLALNTARREGGLLRHVSFDNIKTALLRNYRYPLFSTPEALLNVAGVQIPVLIIAAHVDEEAGFLLLAMQLMAIPMTLLGSSISQVYLSRAREAVRSGTLKKLTITIMRRLALLGVGPITIFGAGAPTIIPFAFGEEWARAGEIILIMVPWIALQFIVSPVSMVMYVLERQLAMLNMNILGFLLRVGAVLLAAHFSPTDLVVSFAAGSLLYYIVVAGFVTNAIRSSPSVS